MKLTCRELCHSLIHLLICLLCAVTFARALRCSPTRSRVHGKEILKMKLQNFLLFPVLDFWSLIWMKGKALYTQPANFWISNDRCILNFGRLFRTSHSHYFSFGQSRLAPLSQAPAIPCPLPPTPPSPHAFILKLIMTFLSHATITPVIAYEKEAISRYEFYKRMRAFAALTLSDIFRKIAIEMKADHVLVC